MVSSITVMATIKLDEIISKYHVDHDDGTFSWKIEPLENLQNWNAVYLQGTASQLRAFGQALVHLADEKENT